jgi:hypothetical protein
MSSVHSTHGKKQVIIIDDEENMRIHAPVDPGK